MTSFIHIVCPHCMAKNRVPTERLNQQAICGKCKTPLINDVPAVLDDMSLAKYIQGNDQPVLIDFWASWCQPCLMMAPQFAQAAMQLPDVRFAKVQTDVHEQAAAQHGIRSLPTMIVFQQGKEVARQSGALSTGQIISWLTQAIRR